MTTAMRYLLYATLALVLPFGSAHAQSDSRVLQIGEGQVTINGKKIAPSNFPRSLDVNSANLYFEYPSGESPVIVVGEGAYVVEADKLRDARPEEIERSGVSAVYSLSNDQAWSVIFNSFTEIERNVGSVQSEQVQEMLRDQTMKARQMAAALPHIERQSYWRGVQESDDELYNSLVREAKLEREVLELADAVRVLPNGEPRTNAMKTIQDRLNELFDIKQENRQREISELEAQLEQLRALMVLREKKRDRIVDKKFRELVGPK